MTSFRFGWIDYFKKENLFIKVTQYFFGILFLHSRQVAYYLFRTISFSKEDHVLDIGCGDGTFGNWISFKTGAQIHGIDISSKRIGDAQATSSRYHLPCKYDCIKIELASFKPDYFSKILIIDILEHIKDPGTILQRCYNWISSGGEVFISIPRRKQKRWLSAYTAEYFSYGEDAHRQVGFEKEEISKLIEKSGFVVISSRELFYTIYQIFWELIEPLRKRFPNLYRILVPLFYPFIIVDRIISFGFGNGIIVIAKKI